jgi:hypothetical protein
MKARVGAVIRAGEFHFSSNINSLLIFFFMGLRKDIHCQINWEHSGLSQLMAPLPEVVVLSVLKLDDVLLLAYEHLAHTGLSKSN